MMIVDTMVLAANNMCHSPVVLAAGIKQTV